MTKLGSRKLHIRPQVTKTGSIIGHRIDYKGVGPLRAQRHIPIYPAKINPSNPPPPGPVGDREEDLKRGGAFYCLFHLKIKKEGVSHRIKGNHKPRKTSNKNYKYQQACVI